MNPTHMGQLVVRKTKHIIKIKEVSREFPLITKRYRGYSCGEMTEITDDKLAHKGELSDLHTYGTPKFNNILRIKEAHDDAEPLLIRHADAKHKEQNQKMELEDDENLIKTVLSVPESQQPEDQDIKENMEEDPQTLALHRANPIQAGQKIAVTLDFNLPGQTPESDEWKAVVKELNDLFDAHEVWPIKRHTVYHAQENPTGNISLEFSVPENRIQAKNLSDALAALHAIEHYGSRKSHPHGHRHGHGHGRAG